MRGVGLWSVGRVVCGEEKKENSVQGLYVVLAGFYHLEKFGEAVVQFLTLGR
jgi:hypothetical protein